MGQMVLERELFHSGDPEACRISPASHVHVAAAQLGGSTANLGSDQKNDRDKERERFNRVQEQ